MMRRRIFLWMGLSVLFASFGLCREGLARETYQVRNGDTLFGISQKIGVTIDALKAANHLKGNRLKSRQILIIPTSAGNTNTSAKSPKPSSPREEVYRVIKGDTLARIAKKTGVTVSELREFNRLQGSALKIGQKLALAKRQERNAAPASMESEKNLVISEPEEEEEDGGIATEEALAEIKRRQQDSAALLGNWNNPDEPKLLVRVAMGFLGAPYRLGGYSVTGLDCSGFVKKIYQVFNIDLPRTAFEQSHVGLRVSRSELVEGDLLFFNTRRKLGHVGIYIGNNEFVHASSRKRGVRVDNLNMPYFNKRFVRAVRLKGSDEGL
ncbi:MAG: C40 family peptidase [Syntrophales bacterium]